MKMAGNKIPENMRHTSIFSAVKVQIALFAVIVLVLFSCSIALYSGDSAFVMKPYLQGMTANSVFVMVESELPEPVVVEYWYKNGTKIREQSYYYMPTDKRNRPTYIHRIELKNLAHGAVCNYKVLQGKDSSDTFNFRTFDESTPLRFAVCGDNASGSDVFAGICKLIKQENPLFLLHAGDVCYSRNYAVWKRDLFIDEFQDLASEAPFYTAIGNHEGWHPNTMAFLRAPNSGSGEQHYYSFEFGDVFFLVLSSQHPAGAGSRQYEYAVKSLSETKKKWKVVICHKSGYCGCPHGNLGDIRELADSVFRRYNTDIVINGHSHFYQRNYTGGIYHFIMGGAGSGLHEPEPEEFSQKTVVAHHFALFEIEKNELKMKVYDLNRTLIDSLEIKK